MPLMASIIVFFNDTATTERYTLSLHDALPIYNQFESRASLTVRLVGEGACSSCIFAISEKNTSELQSQPELVCRLLLETKTQPGGCAGKAPNAIQHRCDRRRRVHS